jgi:hypothetical protein
MYAAGPLDFIPIPFVFLITVAFVLLFLELGFRLGRRRAASPEVEQASSVGAMANASLVLLAFLLSFTFGFAASRHEARRTIFLDEVNAIGTVYLRARILPEAARAEARDLLREYADVRIAAVASGNVEPAVRRSLDIQTRLWEPAAALAESTPGSLVLGLYLQSLNQMIDLHTTRLTESLFVRIPAMLWIVIGAITALSMGEMGYQTGLGGRRRPRSMPAFALGFALVILLIADLDRPQGGWFRVRQDPMIDLRASMAE